ncbi:MAG: transposase [Thiotrichaceae bacterium]|nr:transposase [Thiotrichaceae bacterium]
MKYVPWKDYKAVAADLKKIYQSVTEDEALLALDQFVERWDDKYPQISRSWRNHWENLNTLFIYPDDIRKVIYTTNAVVNTKLGRVPSQVCEGLCFSIVFGWPRTVARYQG